MLPIAKRRLFVLATAIAATVTAALPALPASATPAVSGTGSAFRLFDNTAYTDANVQRNDGIAASGVVYDSWSINCANTTAFSCKMPPKSDYQAKIRFIVASVPATSPITLDFEGIDATAGTPAEQATNDFEAWQTLLQWTREVIPATQPLGAYDYDWSVTPAEISQNAELHQEGLTFFAPSLYTYSTDLNAADLAAWTTRLDEAVANDQQIAPDQPVYPYIWPQWDHGSDAFMDGASWAEELDYLKAHVQGAIIWGGGHDLGSDSCGWVDATRTFTAATTGRATDSGPLTAAFQLPGTCLLTRGQTTSVPLTVTNTTTSTTGPTTLGVSGSQGIVAVPAQRTVPALAAGASWSTTAQVHVGWDASLGDTVLTARLGAGVQHSTAIVQDPDLALGKPATQSSTDGNDTADLAVNGGNDEGLAGGSFSETGADPQAWWQVDLGHDQHIGAIAVTGASGQPSVKNYYVIVSDNPDATAPTTPIPPNQWLQTRPGTWVMSVYHSTFHTVEYKGDTTMRGASGPTVIPTGLAGRYVKVQLAGAGPLALGQVQVRPGTPDGPLIEDTQRVANGGFETGSLAPWTASGTASVAAPALAGSFALQLGANSSTEQVITVKPDTTYTLSGFGELSDAADQAVLGVKGYGGTPASAAITGTTWDQGTLTFTTGHHTTHAVVFYNHTAATGTASLDDVTVTEAGH
ncbi:discoidin domain-containing protein [Streptacidiphilus sp. MAP5-3]|uniref:discoidin domain-containing protein n=1 Tax=unclassified Streptacidiphilus TaxID=2643834 RepID=UPI00351314DD